MTELPPDRLDHPAAWFGNRIARQEDQWVSSLNATEISELEHVASSYLATTDTIGEITPEDFPLPTLGPRLLGLREKLIHGIGFQLLRGLPVDQYDIRTAAAIFCGIGAHLGIARSQNAKGHLLGHVTDVGADLTDPKTRIYQTTARQTFHTDSTDVVGLLCLREAKEGGDSLLVSTVTLYNEMRTRHPDLAPLLFDPVATDRRGEVPEGMDPWFEIPVLNWYKGFLTGLYQRQYVDSAARLEDAPRLSDRHRAALDVWDNLTNDPELNLSMRLTPGDMQFVYNHHLMHDRSGFSDWPEPDKRRHLLRLWLAIPGDRPLPPVFAQRYGPIDVGARGGIVVRDTKLHVSLTP
ncbi:MAG: TauD/TfdA family dioxygenase [Pseudomonadota bacterium]